MTNESAYLGDKDFMQAQVANEEALANADIMSNPEAWYIKARSYHALIDDLNKSEISDINEYSRLVEQAVEAYRKAKSLSTPNSKLYLLANNQIDMLWSKGINAGVVEFQKSEFLRAIDFFDLAKELKNKDTLAFLYAGLSAQKAGLHQEAISNYRELKSFSTLNKDAYSGLIISAKAIKDENDQVLDYVEEARFYHPNHVPFIVEEVTILLSQDRLFEAESILSTASKRVPNNPNILIRQADIYDQLFKKSFLDGESIRSDQYFKKATDKYEQYLKLEPNSFVANYNYSIMLNEQANRAYVDVNLLPGEAYDDEASKLELIGHDWTKRALIYMEQAQKLSPRNQKVQMALSIYYERLKLSDKLLALHGKN